jgi:hypothetical protein
MVVIDRGHTQEDILVCFAFTRQLGLVLILSSIRHPKTPKTTSCVLANIYSRGGQYPFS